MYKICFFCLVVLLYGCNNGKPEEKIDKAKDWNKEKSSEVNKEWVEQEDLQIESYVSRRPNWDVIKTGTGLRYYIYEKNPDGDSIIPGLEAFVKYDISLLDGTVCYSSDTLGNESFVVDREDVESGLHEGVKYMRKGEKAIIIIPHYLALGLIGDRSKIPPLATVIYNIEIVELRIP